MPSNVLTSIVLGGCLLLAPPEGEDPRATDRTAVARDRVESAGAAAQSADAQEAPRRTPAAGGLFRQQPDRIEVAVRAPTRALPPGERLRLEIRVTPKPGIHVYAPGNDDYIPVSVSFDPTPGLAFDEPVFPKGSDYFFAPLAEVVKVYSAPFTIVQPVKVNAGTPKGAGSGEREVPLEGVVRYQACDDKVCFPPDTVPVRVRIRVRNGAR